MKISNVISGATLIVLIALSIRVNQLSNDASHFTAIVNTQMKEDSAFDATHCDPALEAKYQHMQDSLKQDSLVRAQAISMQKAIAHADSLQKEAGNE